MTFTLHAAVIPTCIQMLGTVANLIDKAEAHCAATGIAPADIVGARLADDMLPFAYQVKSVAVHSIGAIEGAMRGTFGPDRTDPPADFAGLRDRIADARAAIEAIDPAAIDALIGREVVFAAGQMRVPFAAEDFLLSFSQPNLYFHATTAYAILRHKGVAIGKRDFLGTMRIKA